MNGKPMGEYVERVAVGSFPLWKDKGPVLGALDIELSERCNNDCVHCCISLPAQDRQAQQRELSTSEVERILDEAAALGALTVRLTGGEPLLRPDFQEIYLHARRLGMKVLIFTNARLITAELAALLARIPPLEKVEITVYGMSAKSYEAVSRVKGSFAEFRRGVELLLEHKVPFVLKTVVLPANRADLGELEAWARTIPGMDKPPSHVAFLDLRARRDSEEKNAAIRALRLSPQDGVVLLHRAGEKHVREMRQFCSKFMGVQGARLFTCGAGHGACVDAYGRLEACLPLRAPELTRNLRRMSLAEALEDLRRSLRDLHATNPDYLRRCARCFLKGLCEQCPARSWTEHGTLDTPVEYLCDVAHAQARRLGLLGEDEKSWEVTDGAARVARLDSPTP
jgi:radical SAM protein with 4Fe4S-binding SPASM domain